MRRLKNPLSLVKDGKAGFTLDRHSRCRERCSEIFYARDRLSSTLNIAWEQDGVSGWKIIKRK